MSTLTITLSSWQSIGSATVAAGAQPGDALTGTATIVPSLTSGGVLGPGLAVPARETVAIGSLPWSYDLLDPTDANPTGWGYTIYLQATGQAAVPVVLSAASIAALTQTSGVRTAALESFVGLSNALGTGGLVAVGAGAQPATAAVPGLVQLAGDLSGTATAPTVTGGTHHGHTAGQVSGLGGAALLSVGTTAGTVAAGDDSRFGTATVIDGVTLTGVPTAGQVPTATSGTAAAWATPAVDGVNPIITASGYWSRTNQGETNGSRAAGTDEVHYTPFTLVRPTSVAALGVIVTTYAASTNTGCAIYANASGLPGAMVAGMTTGTLIPTAAGPITNTVSGTLAAGTYWAGVLLGNNTTARLMTGSFGAYACLESGAPPAGAGPGCLLQYSASLPPTAASLVGVDGVQNQYTMLIEEA